MITMTENEKKITIIFVIQGKEFSIEININENISAAVHKALQLSGNQGSIQGWELRTENGTIVNINSSFKDQNIIHSTKLFLSKGAGRGGSTK